jgi:hypothetical protein
MDRSAHTADSVVLLALLLCSACDVYDASLSGATRSRPRSRKDASVITEAADGSAGDASDDAGEEPRSAEHCGNGVVDRGERCDVAIALGRAGACPEGCSGREGCLQHVLVGSQCAARCVDVRITQAVPDDGCCPSEATAAQDNDCESQCGNGVLERGERCDPPETCAKREACVAADTCIVAKYLGDPKQCTAACEVHAIHACVGGDKCCPAGCSSDRDDDCPVSSASCDGGCSGATRDAGAEDARIECQTKHGMSACEACDCRECADEVSACLTAPGENAAAKCQELSACSVAARCTGIACYCGPVATDFCARLGPGGPCVAELRAIEGRGNLTERIASPEADDALARWVKLSECRARKCRRACSL